jgi:hypothetical protein
MKEKEFRIGDKVLITKGSENWSSEMDKYVDKVATLVSGTDGGNFKIDLDDGYWSWSNKQGHFVHFNMDEDRLQEARKLYPAGTMYNCANSYQDGFIVENPELFSIPEPNVIYGELGKGAIYYKGKWAKILEKPSDLVKFGDKIEFKVKTYDVYSYKVCTSFLSSLDSELGNNSKIFNALGMDEDAKVKFCNDAYGYPSEGGDFPTCKKDDYEALTNVVKHLYDACNKFNVYGKVKTEEEKWRF